MVLAGELPLLPCNVPHFDAKLKIEQYMKELGLQVTVIKPAWLMDSIFMYSELQIQPGYETVDVDDVRTLA